MSSLLDDPDFAGLADDLNSLDDEELLNEDSQDGIDYEKINRIAKQAAAHTNNSGGTDSDYDDLNSESKGDSEHDAAIYGELAQLEMQVKKEKGGGNGSVETSMNEAEFNTASDDELAALEAEDNRKIKPKKQATPPVANQPLTNISTTTYTPSTSTSSPTTDINTSQRTTDADLMHLQHDLLRLKHSAVQLKQQNKTVEALEVMKQVKVLQLKIQLAEKSLSSEQQVKDLKKSQSSTSNVNQQSMLSMMNKRLKEYQVAAVAHNRAKRMAEARTCMQQIQQLKTAIQSIQSNQPIDINQLPPDLFTPTTTTIPVLSSTPAATNSSPPHPPRPQSINTSLLPPSTNPSPSKHDLVRQSSLTAIQSAVSGITLTVRQGLEYDTLLAKLQKQISELDAAMRTTIATGNASKTSKLVALQYHRSKKQSQTDYELVLAARNKMLPPPHTKEEQVKVQHELRFDDLADDVVQVTVHKCTELQAKTTVSNNSDDLNPFIVAKYDYSDNDISFTTEAKKKTGSPVFEHNHQFKIEKRSKMTARKIRQSKLSFTVFHKRFLLSAVEIGHCEMKVKDLMEKAELVENIKLKSPSGARAGEITVTVRVRQPFEALDIRDTAKTLIIVEEFVGNDGSTSINIPHQPIAVSSHAVQNHNITAASTATYPTPSTTTAPVPVATPAPIRTPLPAGLTEADISDPHNIADMVSNDVLEAELALTQQSLVHAQASKNSELIDELTTRLQLAQTQLTILVTAVQNGNLSLDAYLEKLKEMIKKFQSIAVVLKQRNQKTDAIRVLRRVNIMKNEVESAESNRDQLDE